MKRNKILLVEDDENLGYVIHDNLTLKGFNVTWCKDGEEGWSLYNTAPADLCLLDVMLPKIDGFTLAQRIRHLNKGVPILFLTAKGMLEDKLAGFKSGGDDYISKPFSMEELICRIEVFLRRGDHHEPRNTFVLGAYQFDFLNLSLNHQEEKKSLTTKEAGILKMLIENRNRVLKREEILKAIWGDDDYFAGRSMDVFISKLRKYLKKDTSVQIINYHGIGFKLQENK